MSDRRGKKTHDDMWDSGTQGLITRIAVVAALAGLLFGFDTGVISGALDYIGDAFNLGDIGKSAVVSSVLLGAVVGSIVAMAIIDRIGRRRSLIASGAVFIVGSIASAVAPGVGALDIARLLLGVAIGISAVAAPMYITEIAPAARRGRRPRLSERLAARGPHIFPLTSSMLAGAGAHADASASSGNAACALADRTSSTWLKSELPPPPA